jgi:hypothetical protein
MTPLPIRDQTSPHPCSWRWAPALALTFAMAQPGGSIAQDSLRGAASAPVASARPKPKAAAEQGTRWSEMKPAQQATLKPLEQDWSGFDASQKQKWLQVAAGFPRLSAPEQARVQARMADWTKLTPQERGQARLNFQEATQVPAQDRQDRWDAYQALSAEQKRQLAARATPAASAAAHDSARKPSAPDGRQYRTAASEPVQGKSNIVPNPALANRPKPVSPTVVQATAGATTTTITKRPMPPPHQQAGMPKIAATPEFVDKATLLPQRGPQGAAIHAEPASNPTPAPRK